MQAGRDAADFVPLFVPIAKVRRGETLRFWFWTFSRQAVLVHASDGSASSLGGSPALVCTSCRTRAARTEKGRRTESSDSRNSRVGSPKGRRTLRASGRARAPAPAPASATRPRACVFRRACERLLAQLEPSLDQDADVLLPCEVGVVGPDLVDLGSVRASPRDAVDRVTRPSVSKKTAPASFAPSQRSVPSSTVNGHAAPSSARDTCAGSSAASGSVVV